MHPRLKEIQDRLVEIRALLQKPDADLDALEAEITALTEERDGINAAIEKRSALIAAVTSPDTPVVRSFPTPTQVEQPQTFDASSPEFRTAWLKHMASRTRKERPDAIGFDTTLTDLEQRAFTYLTSNTPNVIPGGISLGIEEMISKEYALLQDLSPTSIQGVIEFSQAAAIAAGKAAETDENTANSDDLKITFTKVTMTGVEIRGDAVIGAKMRILALDGFEQFIIDEVGRQLGEAKNLHVVDAIDDDMTSGNVVTPTSGLADADLRQAFGLLKGGRGARNVYASGNTIWNHIAGVVDADESGKKLFIASPLTDDPTVQGFVYGSKVKLDDTITDGLIYIGYPARVKANDFEGVSVLPDLDVKTRAVTYGGFCIFEARLGDTRSWVKIDVTEDVS
jgi:HK97 family phage major capsid protein